MCLSITLQAFMTPEGFEPTTPELKVQCSGQTELRSQIGLVGIEPTHPVCKIDILPLDYRPVKLFLGFNIF